MEFKSLRESATDPADISAILLAESIAYCELCRLDKATEAASEAVRLLPEENPGRPYAEFSLACVHEQDGKLDFATQEFKILLKKYSDLLRSDEYTPFRRGVQLRLIAGLIVLGQAIEPLSIAVKLRTEDIPLDEKAELSYREAQAHALLGRHDRALKLYQEAVCGPLERSLAARAHFHIGEILYDRGEFSRALDEFKNAEGLAEAGNPDRELLAKWISHTSRAVAHDNAAER